SAVTLYDSSMQGATSWKWSVSPSATANINGPDNQATASVSFLKSGFYAVKLKAANSLGEDSLEKTNYIEVFDYCDPVVGSLSQDVAISRVQFGTIDNYSSVGQNGFTSYLNDFTAVEVSPRGVYPITIERNSVVDSMNRKVWIDWNNDGDFNDSLELVAYEPVAKTQRFHASILVPDFAVLGYTTLRVGVSYGQDVNKPCGINPSGEFEDYPVRIVLDQDVPVITRLGSDTVWLEKGYAYVD